MKEAMIDKNKIVKFVVTLHERLYDGKPISRIKLQKTLYFLYAHWIKFYDEVSHEGNELHDLVSDGYSEILFDSDFTAWTYGPVDTSIYYLHKNSDLTPFSDDEMNSFMNDLRNKYELVSEYIIPMTRRIFNTSDFSLVDLSHKDEGWISNYNKDFPMQSKSISHEAIRADYVKKEIK